MVWRVDSRVLAWVMVVAGAAGCTGSSKDACRSDQDCLNGNTCSADGVCTPVTTASSSGGNASSVAASSSGAGSSGNAGSSSGLVSSGQASSSGQPSSSGANSSSVVVVGSSSTGNNSSAPSGSSMGSSSAAASSSSAPASSLGSSSALGVSSSGVVVSSSSAPSSSAPYVVNHTRLHTGVARSVVPSPNGQYVAFLTAQTNGYGTLNLGSTAGAAGSTQPLGQNVYQSLWGVTGGYRFSPNSAWLGYVQDLDPQTAQGGNSVLVPTAGGVAQPLGNNVHRESSPLFSPDGATAFFVDAFTNGAGGRLRRQATSFGTASTVGTGVFDVRLSPDGRKLVYATNRSSSVADLQFHDVDLNSTTQVGTGVSVPYAFGMAGVEFLPSGRLRLVDGVVNGLGTLRMRETNGVTRNVMDNVNVNNLMVSPNEVRMTVERGGPMAGTYWGAVAGGPLVNLGANAWGTWLFDDDVMIYLANAQTGSPTYGDLTLVRVGSPPQTIATGVPELAYPVGFQNTSLVYLSGYDFGAQRGTLQRLDRATGASTQLATNVYRNVVWSEDGDHIAYLTAYDAAGERGRLSVMSVSNPGSAVELSNSTHRFSFRIHPNGDKVMFLDNYNATTQTGDLTLCAITGQGCVVVAANQPLCTFLVDPFTLTTFEATRRYTVLLGYLNEDTWVLDWEAQRLTALGTVETGGALVWAGNTHRLLYTRTGGDQGLWVTQFP